MADDLGDKTEPPTPKRREESRRKGQVARSQDLPAAVLMFSGMLALLFLGPGLWDGLLQVMHVSLDAGGRTAAGDLPALAGTVALRAFRNVAYFMAILLLLAILVMYFQVGFLFTWAPLTPRLEKLSPLAGVKRIFSPRTAVQLVQNLAKLTLVCGAAYLTVAGSAAPVLFSANLDFPAMYPLAWDLVFRLGMNLALVMIVLGLLDFAYQRHRHEKDLKMSKQEVKEELRSMEGDPVLKRRRMQVQMQLAMQRIRQDVPQADVVVTNPTHYAVALRYDPDSMAAPRVVAKGADFLAQRIREVAAAAGVPIVERPLLARMIYAEVEVGREVPGKFFEAVAEILAYIYELTGRRMRPEPVPVG
ncbi:MAG: flagellar biosynthesis protein FlhB [bacterium]|nr:flagellar biosynthesis protein FlhB [bacterium]